MNQDELEFLKAYADHMLSRDGEYSHKAGELVMKLLEEYKRVKEQLEKGYNVVP